MIPYRMKLVREEGIKWHKTLCHGKDEMAMGGTCRGVPSREMAQ